MSKSAIYKSLRRAERIDPFVANAIRDLPAADSGVELDAIASLHPEEQRVALARVNSGASKTFREAKQAIVGRENTSTFSKALERLRQDWASAPDDVRRVFFMEITVGRDL